MRWFVCVFVCLFWWCGFALKALQFCMLSLFVCVFYWCSMHVACVFFIIYAAVPLAAGVVFTQMAANRWRRSWRNCSRSALIFC